MNDGQMPLLPERLKCRQRRMQPEEAVEIDHRLARNIDAGPHGVVLRFGVRDNDVQAVSGAALKNDDEALGAPAILYCAKGRASEKAWYRRRPDDGERAVAKEDATRNGHENSS